MTEKLLSPQEAAAILGIKPNTLAVWRTKGTGPTFTKLGSRTVRYRSADIAQYVNANSGHANTAQAAAHV